MAAKRKGKPAATKAAKRKLAKPTHEEVLEERRVALRDAKATLKDAERCLRETERECDRAQKAVDKATKAVDKAVDALLRAKVQASGKPATRAKPAPARARRKSRDEEE
jgi:ribosome recycling factor